MGIERLQSKVYRTSYPSHILAPLDREKYDEGLRTTRLALRNHTGEQLLEELERALNERDLVLSQAIYREALHCTASSADLSEALGAPTSEAHRVVERYHRACPDRREAYEEWRAAKAQRDDPVRILFRGLRQKAGPRREAGDTIGDGGEFLSDLLGGNRG